MTRAASTLGAETRAAKALDQCEQSVEAHAYVEKLLELELRCDLPRAKLGLGPVRILVVSRSHTQRELPTQQNYLQLWRRQGPYVRRELQGCAHSRVKVSAHRVSVCCPCPLRPKRHAVCAPRRWRPRGRGADHAECCGDTAHAEACLSADLGTRTQS